MRLNLMYIQWSTDGYWQSGLRCTHYYYDDNISLRAQRMLVFHSNNPLSIKPLDTPSMWGANITDKKEENMLCT